jgi:hypothetical protein
MSNNSRQEQKNLPSDEPVGELEPVAHFPVRNYKYIINNAI